MAVLCGLLVSAASYVYAWRELVYREGYVEPIAIQPICLACHGKDLGADIASQINTLYPDDEATGFEIDELRGVYWVEYPVAHTTEGH